MAERELTRLVNEKNVRLAIKKLFNGDVSQIIGETIQNASRAGAKRVEFTTSSKGPTGAPENKICVRDDGTGILNGVDGWHTLLSIAESSYLDENVNMQAPLGIGFYALLACARVHKVTIRSKGRMIKIDTDRWWTDSTYYSTWAQRLIVIDSDDGGSGLELEIECDSKFIEGAIRSLTAKEEVYRSHLDLPARGYEGVIDITLNGGSVDTSVLSKFYHPDSLLVWEGDYLGNQLKIAHGPRSSVNWFGQAVEDPLLDGGFSFYLNVRTGTPLDLQSPTRYGVIKNEKREALKRFIVDRIFEAVNGAPIEDVRLEWVRGLYQLDPPRADAEAKYYVAGKIGNSAEVDFSSNEEFEYCEEEVKAYDQEGVLLVYHGVTVECQDGGEKRLVQQHGIETFVHDLQRVYGEPYKLVVGDRGRLRVREVVWRPRKAGNSIFVDPGVFTLREKGVKSQEWHAVTEEVFTFESSAAYDILDAQPLVAAKDRHAWLNSQYPWGLFDPSDAENSFETCSNSFENSITDIIMYEFPDMIAERFSLSDLSRRLSGGKVTAIFVTWPDKERPLLKVVGESGQEMELRVI